MDKGIFATVEHRKLMELKNCGAVDAEGLENLAHAAFIDLKFIIKDLRGLTEKQSFLSRITGQGWSISREVDLMFTNRQELIDHLSAISVPSKLCPVTEDQRDRLLFLDRAARYAGEAQKIMDMFKRHHEVIVDSDRSLVIEWVLTNSQRLRQELIKGL